jgi:hypothetical protein
MFDWIIGGTTYSLDDGTYCYIQSHSGMGMMPVRRLEQRGPQQNGVSDRGYRLDERTIIMQLYVPGSTYSDLYDKRTSLLSMFKARDTAGKLRFSLGSTSREIQAHYIGDSLGMDDDAFTGFTKPVAIALRCPDPRWYDPTINTSEFSLGGGSNTFVVPFEVPFNVGSSTIDITRTVTYSGNIKSYPTIRITGPITDPVITHGQTGYKLDFTGITIAAGDWYEIDLGYAGNTVEDDAGTNKIADLTTDSDLVDFAIEADPDVTGGVNSINVTGSSVSEATEIMITYYDYYLGI